MKNVNKFLILSFLMSLLPVSAFAGTDTFLHFTRLYHVSESEFPVLNNTIYLRTYGKSANGYTVPVGYRTVKPTSNLCITPISDTMLELVDDIFKHSPEGGRFSGNNVVAKVKVAGVSHYTLTRYGQIINRQHEVRKLSAEDFDLVSLYFNGIVDASDCRR